MINSILKIKENQYIKAYKNNYNNILKTVKFFLHYIRIKFSNFPMADCMIFKSDCNCWLIS